MFGKVNQTHSGNMADSQIFPLPVQTGVPHCLISDLPRQSPLRLLTPREPGCNNHHTIKSHILQGVDLLATEQSFLSPCYSFTFIFIFLISCVAYELLVQDQHQDEQHHLISTPCPKCILFGVVPSLDVYFKQSLKNMFPSSAYCICQATTDKQRKDKAAYFPLRFSTRQPGTTQAQG